MSSVLRLLRFASLSVLLFSSVLPKAMADEGSLFVQTLDGRLVTGRPIGQSAAFMSQRVFLAQFPSTFAWSNPGFHSLSTPPADVESLPESIEIEFDFLPMIANGHVSNLLYWDGEGAVPEDVRFGPPPGDGYTMTLFGRDNEPGEVSGSGEMIAGAVLGRTEAGPGLRMHEHRFFFLDDGDDLSDPEQGIYLIAMQLRTETLRATPPFYLLWSTLNTSPTALQFAARPWVEDRVDQLVLDGDFNFDGFVNSADYDVWSSQIGYNGPFPHEGSYADGNRDGTVNAADLAIWEASLSCDPNGRGDLDANGLVDFADFLVLSANFGQPASTHVEGDIDCNGTVDFADFLALSANFGKETAGFATVPEPSGKAVTLLGLALALRIRKNR